LNNSKEWNPNQKRIISEKSLNDNTSVKLDEDFIQTYTEKSDKIEEDKEEVD